MKVILQGTKCIWGWSAEILAQTVTSVFKGDWHSLCLASLPTKKKGKKKAIANTKPFKCPKHTTQTKELLNWASLLENAARKGDKTTLSAPAFVSVPVTWRRLSPDSVKSNHQHTRDWVCKRKTAKEISTWTLAIYLKRFILQLCCRRKYVAQASLASECLKAIL